jgi:hypothetical protein
MMSENQHKKQIKVEFDLQNEVDRNLFSKLEQLALESNSGPLKYKLRPADLLKAGLKLLTPEHLKPLKRSFMSEREVLNLWAQNYNLENKKELTSDEFAVQILPKMNKKMLLKLETNI